MRTAGTKAPDRCTIRVRRRAVRLGLGFGIGGGRACDGEQDAEPQDAGKEEQGAGAGEHVHPGGRGRDLGSARRSHDVPHLRCVPCLSRRDADDCAASRPKEGTRKPLESHFKTDAASGRLQITEEDMDDGAEGPSDMGAYLEAMRGEDGHTRDAKGKARFNKTQGKRARGDDEFGEGDLPVTAGLKELDVAGGGRKKKVKRETVRIGAEFKAKVRISLDLAQHLTVPTASRWRCQERRRRAVRVHPAPERRGQTKGGQRAEARHHGAQEEGREQIVCCTDGNGLAVPTRLVLSLAKFSNRFLQSSDPHSTGSQWSAQVLRARGSISSAAEQRIRVESSPNRC